MALKRLGLSRLSLRRSFAEVGGGAELPPAGLVTWSPADYAHTGQNALNVAGDFTLGTRFEATRPDLVCTGARVVVFTAAAPQTVTIELWNASSDALLASAADQVLGSVGVHSVLFDSPVALGGAGNDIFTISIWRNDSANHTRFGNPAELPAVPLNAGAIVFQYLNLFGAGHQIPKGESGANRYPIGPIIEEA